MPLNIRALREERSAKAKEARNLLDTKTGADFTAEVRSQIDALYEEIDRIDAQIERADRQARIDGDAQLGEQRNEAVDRRRASLTPEQREQQDRYSAAFHTYIIGGVSALSREEADVLRTGRPQNAQSAQPGNGAAGGYLVPTGWGGELLQALKAFGGMRGVATIIQTASGIAIPWPTVDETGQMGEIVPENQGASSQDASFGTTSIGAWKWSSKVFTIPLELLMDQGPGIDVEGFVRSAAATRIARIQNNKYTVGSGNGEPTGVVTSSPVGVVGATGQTGSVLPDNLIDLEHSIDPAYRAKPGVGWMFHDTTLRTVKKMKDNQNRPLWLPGFETKEPDTFLGYRYQINQDMPQQVANAKSILFGDLSEFLIRDILEVTLFRFDDSPFMIKGQIGFLAWARGDGKMVSAGQPVKAFQQSAS